MSADGGDGTALPRRAFDVVLNYALAAAATETAEATAAAAAAEAAASSLRSTTPKQRQRLLLDKEGRVLVPPLPKALWGLCKEVEAVCPRFIALHDRTPPEIATRLAASAQARRFPLYGVRLGMRTQAEHHAASSRRDTGKYHHLLTALPPYKALRVGCSVEAAIPCLPHTLESLVFEDAWQGSAGFEDKFEVCDGLDQDELEGFNHPLPPLPSSLRELVIGKGFNHPINFSASDSPQSASAESNRASGGAAAARTAAAAAAEARAAAAAAPGPSSASPPSLIPLRRLVLGAAFRQPLPSLPSTLESLTLGYHQDFNYTPPPFDATIAAAAAAANANAGGAATPAEIAAAMAAAAARYHAEFSMAGGGGGGGAGTAQPSFLVLPAGLKQLTFGSRFNRSDVILPDSLRELTYGSNFNCPLPSKLPSQLQKLHLGVRWHQTVPHLEDVPLGLQEVTFDSLESVVGDHECFLSVAELRLGGIKVSFADSDA